MQKKKKFSYIPDDNNFSLHFKHLLSKKKESFTFNHAEGTTVPKSLKKKKKTYPEYAREKMKLKQAKKTNKTKYKYKQNKTPVLSRYTNIYIYIYIV